ncbi:hypothetical protein Hypma_001186 [Hypsizygus marmoreus]|uniref:Uncharacterized protein n=1 Tax=Hypsizygus marmoreus TaxID=39966 RepID=A0A369JFA8_HYPMA|nr:hypothetical protein Hypma_001186 [Hypsizygus marmoreus]
MMTMTGLVLVSRLAGTVTLPTYPSTPYCFQGCFSDDKDSLFYLLSLLVLYDIGLLREPLFDFSETTELYDGAFIIDGLNAQYRYASALTTPSTNVRFRTGTCAV